MNRRLISILMLLLIPAIGIPVLADSTTDAAIRKSLQRVLPDSPPDKITPSPVAGLSEVQIGSRLIYVTNDGKYLFQGSLIDLATREDISETSRKAIRIAAINKVGEENMIIFPAKDPRHTITVFTDVDCGYCRKLHSQIQQYNDEGITVRYLFYPRSGINTPSYYTAVSVWCEEDRKKAITDAKLGKQIPRKDCTNPVKEEYELGQSIGIRGTPAIILEDGDLLPGYIPPGKLARALDAGS
ncbi:MAG: thioredoxin fold domain-containing protein [Gammaproteobacteria bacterium]